MLLSPSPPSWADIRPLRRVEYDQLIALGAFEGERLELIRGGMISRPPQRPGHSYAVERLMSRLMDRLDRRASVRVRQGFFAAGESEPEPDLAVVPRRNYSEEHPSEALLIVEVADSSLRFDRDTKGPLYAESRVDEYWIVAIERGCIQVYRDPSDGNWNTSFTVGRDGTISPLAFPDLVINVAEILP